MDFTYPVTMTPDPDDGGYVVTEVEVDAAYKEALDAVSSLRHILDEGFARLKEACARPRPSQRHKILCDEFQHRLNLAEKRHAACQKGLADAAGQLTKRSAPLVKNALLRSIDSSAATPACAAIGREFDMWAEAARAGAYGVLLNPLGRWGGKGEVFASSGTTGGKASKRPEGVCIGIRQILNDRPDATALEMLEWFPEDKDFVTKDEHGRLYIIRRDAEFKTLQQFRCNKGRLPEECDRPCTATCRHRRARPVPFSTFGNLVSKERKKRGKSR